MAGWFEGDTVEAPPITGWWAELILNFVGGIDSGEAFGEPRIAINQTLFASGISSGEAFGTPALRYRQFIGPAGISSLEAFGGSALDPGTVTLVPQGIPTGEGVGTPSVAPGETLVLAAGISSQEAHGTASIDTGPVDVGPTGIESAEQFSVPRATNIVDPASIVSEESFGLPLLTQHLTAVGVPSAEAFGGVNVAGGRQIIGPAGIASLEAFGGSALNPGAVAVLTQGIPSLEAVGVPTIARGPVSITAPGIASAQAFGSPRLASTILAAGIASQEAFGVARLGRTVAAPGIGSAEGFGTPIVERLQANPVEFASVGAGASKSLTGTTLSWSATANEGDLVWVDVYHNNAPGSVTYGDTEMEPIGAWGRNNGATLDLRRYVHRVTAATAGTVSVLVSGLTANAYAIANSYAYRWAGSYGATQVAYGSSSTASQTVTALPGQLILQTFLHGGSYSSGSGGTERYRNNVSTIARLTTRDAAGATTTFTNASFAGSPWVGIATVMSP